MPNIEIEIELNGLKHQLEAHKNVEELIADLSLSGKAVAVAINREIVARSQWSQRKLQAADCVDVVRAIGGG
jgi:sulfur carrier protein